MASGRKALSGYQETLGPPSDNRPSKSRPTHSGTTRVRIRARRPDIHVGRPSDQGVTADRRPNRRHRDRSTAHLLHHPAVFLHAIDRAIAIVLCNSSTPSFTVPPVPQAGRSRFPSFTSPAASRARPRMTVTALPPRPFASRPTSTIRTSRNVAPAEAPIRVAVAASYRMASTTLPSARPSSTSSCACAMSSSGKRSAMLWIRAPRSRKSVSRVTARWRSLSSRL